MRKFNKLWLSLALILGFSVQIAAQVSGTPARPIVSDGTKPIYYYIESASDGVVRSGRNYLEHLMYDNGSNPLKHDKIATITAAGIHTDNALWQIVKDGTYTKLKNKGTGLYLTDGKNRSTLSAVTGQRITFTALNNPATQYLIVCQGNTQTSAWNFGSGNVIDMYGTTALNDVAAWYLIVEPNSMDNYNESLTVAAKAALATTISNAETLYDNTEVGTIPGKFTSESRTTFYPKIQDAIAVRDSEDPTLTYTDYDNATATLNTAMLNYRQSGFKPATSTADVERWYRIQGTRPVTNGYLTSKGVGSQLKVEALVAPGDNDTQLWKFVQSGTGLAIVNKATGAYLDANSTGNVTLVNAQPTNILQTIVSDITTDDKTARFWIEEIEGGAVDFRLHAATGGVLNWTGNAYQHSAWIIEHVKNTVETPTLNGGDWSDAANWLGGVKPTATDNVIINGYAILDEDATVNNLTINNPYAFSVENKLTITGTGNIIGAGLIAVASNATIVGDISGKAEVFRSTDKRPYYMSSPVHTHILNVQNLGKISTFDIAGDKWSDLKAPSVDNMNAIAQGIGFFAQAYIVKNKFTGTLNSGNIAVELKQGVKNYNFLGNPYPAYLKSADLISHNTDKIDGTIWQRTQNADVFFYITYNKAGSGATLPVGYDGSLIAPMQGFWVKATSATTVSDFFTNAMRSHNTVGEKALFKAPQQIVSQRFILNISNGTSSDEAMLRFNPDAGTGIDDWDSDKMMNDISALNIYTVDKGTNLAINSYPSITEGVEIPVGLNIGAGTYTLSAKNFINFAEGTKVNLIDKETGLVTDLATGSYEFSLAEALNNSTRFALVFPKANVGTGIDTQASKDVFAFVREGRIVVNTTDSGTIYVFNGVGQRVAAQTVSGTVTEIETALPAGVYVVKLNNLTTKVVVK